MSVRSEIVELGDLRSSCRGRPDAGKVIEAIVHDPRQLESTLTVKCQSRLLVELVFLFKTFLALVGRQLRIRNLTNEVLIHQELVRLRPLLLSFLDLGLAL